MGQVVYVKDGKVEYYERSLYTKFVFVFCCFYLACFIISVMIIMGSDRNSDSEFSIRRIIRSHFSNVSQEKVEQILVKIKEQLDRYYIEEEKTNDKIKSIIIVIIYSIIMILFWYLLLKFNSLYLTRKYPFYMSIFYFLIYCASGRIFDKDDIGPCLKADIDRVDDMIANMLSSHKLKQHRTLIFCVVVGIAIIIYYLWEIFFKDEYDIVASDETTCWVLWIDPRLFRAKVDEWSSSCYIEIPREIALLIFDGPPIKHSNDVKFYVRESGKETLVCKFIDGSVIYSKIHCI